MSRVAPSPTAARPTPATIQVPRDRIAQRAYEKWVQRGRNHGNDQQDWIEAENELRAEYARMSGLAPARR
jgi:hypothetical protein